MLRCIERVFGVQHHLFIFNSFIKSIIVTLFIYDYLKLQFNVDS